MSLEEEREFLAPFLEQAATGGVLVVGQIKAALDKRMGREVALASAYNLLHRHNWRKLAPDKRHPQSDPLASGGVEKKLPEALAGARNRPTAVVELCFRLPSLHWCAAPKQTFGKAISPIRPFTAKTVDGICSRLLFSVRCHRMRQPSNNFDLHRCVLVNGALALGLLRTCCWSIW